MTTISTTFSNNMAELIAPLLIAIRETGFFEAYVFIPIMTVLSIFLFIKLKQKADVNGTFSEPLRLRYKKVFLFSFYSLCFLAANSTAVAFKSMILEEMDYEKWVWFIPYVSALHFYITSIALAHIYLIYTNQSTALSRFVCVYIQIGYIGGYGIAIYRIIFEPFNLLDVTTGISGIFMIAWFGILNLDIVKRFFRPMDKLYNPMIKKFLTETKLYINS